MLKNYLLTFDINAVMGSYNKLVAFIQSNGTTYQFSIPFPGLVLLKSYSSLAVINDSYNAFFDGEAYIIMELNTHASGGRLPSDVWKWLNDQAPPPIPFQPLGPK